MRSRETKAEHWPSSRGCRSLFLNQFLSRALWIYAAAGCQTEALEEGHCPCWAVVGETRSSWNPFSGSFMAEGFDLGQLLLPTRLPMQ